MRFGTRPKSEVPPGFAPQTRAVFFVKRRELSATSKGTVPGE